MSFAATVISTYDLNEIELYVVEPSPPSPQNLRGPCPAMHSGGTNSLFVPTKIWIPYPCAYLLSFSL